MPEEVERVVEGNDAPLDQNEERWVEAMGRVLNLNLPGREPDVIREVQGGAVEMQDMLAQNLMDDDDHREILAQTSGDAPRKDSPLRTESKPDGTMVIDPYSVPASIAVARRIGPGAQYDPFLYVATEHATDVKGKVREPVMVGQERPDYVLASGATGYLQKYGDDDSAVIKRPYGYSPGPGEPTMFVGAQSIIHEAKILTALSEFPEAEGAQNIIQTKGSGITEAGEPFVILETLKGGSLEERVPKDRGMEPEALNVFASGFLAGVSFLQKRNIFHQDLKADNILFRDNESTDPVIIDFDSASAHEGVAADREDGKTQEYMIGGAPQIQPPERFEANAEITGKVDSWSGGLLLMAAAIGSDKQQQFIDEIADYRKAGPKDQGALDQKMDQRLADTPDNIKGAIKGLLKVDAEERLSATDALDIVAGRRKP